MYQSSILDFMRKLLNNIHISSFLIKEPFDDVADFDLGLRRLLNPDIDFVRLFRMIPFASRPNTMYRVTDKYHCSYTFMELPGAEVRTFFLIGPYTFTEISEQTILEYTEEFNLPPAFAAQLCLYYYALPYLPNDAAFFSMLNTFCEEIWDGTDNYTIVSLSDDVLVEKPAHPSAETLALCDSPQMALNILEERYDMERQFMQAVSQGSVSRAEQVFSQVSYQTLEQRLHDPIRDIKNYTIILNTLLRKAAEFGAVHPIHIDKISSGFAKRIELLNSTKAARSLQSEMVRKYALLVKNHSLKKYSLLVQKVISQVDFDLTADLSLKAMAELLNVNASYLSTLFKKETGTTLTDYVNRKRIDHAILLLNSTTMQIQTIAQHCGISDLNYFTKMFKKFIGKTPSEYRDFISS